MTPNGLARAGEVFRSRNFSLESLGHRLISLVQFFRPSDGWLSVVLLALNLMVVVWSVEKAQWVATPNLPFLIVVAMATGLVLSRIPIWAVFVLPVGLALGLLIIVWQLVSLEATGIHLTSSSQLWERLGLWFQAARSGDISIDQLPFAFGLMVLTWLSGYLAAWVFFRYRNFWGVFILGGAGLLSNLTYLPASASVDLGLYLFTALLLVARVRSVRRRLEWQRRNIEYDGHLGVLSLSDSFFLALVVLLVAFFIPHGDKLGPANAAYELFRSPIRGWEEDFNRLFAGLPARRPIAYRIWGDVMAFQGTINPTTTPVLAVESPVPMYWKARTYGTYTSKGWVSEGTVIKPVDWTPTYSSSQPYLGRLEVTYAVTPHYASDRLFAGGHILGADREAQIETYDSPAYVLDLDPRMAIRLPPRLAQARSQIGRLVGANGGSVSNPALAESLPDDFRLVDVSRNRGGAVRQVTLAEVVPEQPDVLSLSSNSGTIAPGNTYQVVSAVSVATPDQLRSAGKDYPTWALHKYTQLPADLPQRVRDLAAQLTATAETPYDKAKAIEDYLKTFPYTLSVEPPPFNADGVDHFLFTVGPEKGGYSEYFGSSMTVLLRSVGVPARLATGYTVGDKVADQNVYIVTDSHSHAWVEVFFPRYGWIAFEPTPGTAIPEAALSGAGGSGIMSAGGVSEFQQECFDEFEFCIEGTFDVPTGNASFRSNTFAARLLQVLPWLLSGLVLVTVAGGGGWWFWRRYMAPSDDPQSAFRHLAFLGALGSVGLAAHQTPFQYRQRLEEEFPAHRQHVSVIIDSYVRSLYGRKQLSHDEQRQLVRAWLGLRLALLLRIFRRRNR